MDLGIAYSAKAALAASAGWDFLEICRLVLGAFILDSPTGCTYPRDVMTPYEQAGYAQHEPKRPRKLLLHRRQLKRLVGKVQEKGLTLIPLGLHFNTRGYAKVSIGLARGRQTYDKRRAIKDRETKRDIQRQMRRH